MKIKIIKSISFIIILIFILMILSQLVIPKNTRKEDGMQYKEASGILAEDKNTIDVLFAGDSELMSSIIPVEMWNEYGFTSYLCSSLEQTIPEEIYLLAKALENQKPKMIVLEANNLFMGTEIADLLGKTVEYFIPVFKYHDRWKSLNSNDFKTHPKYSHKNYLKGYHYSDSVISVEKDNYMDIIEKEAIMPRVNKIYMMLLKKYCDDNGIKLLVVSTPSCINWNRSNHDVLSVFLESINIEFLDMNVLQDEIDIDWRHDSKDGGDHLNFYGAKKVTKYLGKYLNDKNILPDHRNDDKYNVWNKSYEKYKELENKN